ncbi:MAG: hypothetical protein AAGG11_05030 [Pseudomonadota bacterium]
MSAFSLARTAIDTALDEASSSAVDRETLLRAIVSLAVEKYREGEGLEATRSMLEFQLTNCAGDEDHEFMRP